MWDAVADYLTMQPWPWLLLAFVMCAAGVYAAHRYERRLDREVKR